MGLIDIAQRMGLKPWKLYGGSRLLWFARYEAMREYELKAAVQAAVKAKNKPGSVDSINAKQGRR